MRPVCPVLLEDDSHPVDGFAGVGTPAAYLLDEEGRVEDGLALGADKVPEVLRRALGARRRLSSERPLSDSRLERDGLRAGTLAPPFTLPGLDGETASLSDYRGQCVLLVFSDPNADHVRSARGPVPGCASAMRIKLVGKSIDGSSVWQREVERPYPAVPRADEWVYLGESDDAEGLFATPVAVVTWENDGRVMLRFDVGGGAQADRWLRTLGFTQEGDEPR